jgi:hypothetical protein
MFEDILVVIGFDVWIMGLMKFDEDYRFQVTAFAK